MRSTDHNFKLFTQLKKDVATDLEKLKYKIRIQKATFD